IVDLGVPVTPFIVRDPRQLASRGDQPFGESGLVEHLQRARMDREGVAVLSRPLVHVDDLHTHPVLLQEQGRNETDGTGADDEDLRIGVMEHPVTYSMFASCARMASMGAFAHANIGVSRCVWRLPPR